MTIDNGRDKLLNFDPILFCVAFIVSFLYVGGGFYYFGTYSFSIMICGWYAHGLTTIFALFYRDRKNNKRCHAI